MHPELLWREGCAFRESAKIKADVKKKLLEGQENSKFKGPFFFFSRQAPQYHLSCFLHFLIGTQLKQNKTKQPNSLSISQRFPDFLIWFDLLVMPRLLSHPVLTDVCESPVSHTVWFSLLFLALQ